MNIEPITFESPEYTVKSHHLLDDYAVFPNGATCYFTAEDKTRHGFFNMSWKFYWEELKLNGIDGLSGHITMKSSNAYKSTIVNVDLTEETQVVSEIISMNNDSDVYKFSYEITLIPYFHEEFVEEEEPVPVENLQSSENDAILVVEGKKFNVNKAFLSYHSEYFDDLFSSIFEEERVFLIENVNYDDFGLLLSTVDPKIVFPTDETVEKILELADRFKFPAAFKQAQHHLLHVSTMDDVEKLFLADKYEISELCGEILGKLDSLEKMKSLKSSKRFSELSDETILKLFNRIIELI